MIFDLDSKSRDNENRAENDKRKARKDNIHCSFGKSLTEAHAEVTAQIQRCIDYVDTVRALKDNVSDLGNDISPDILVKAQLDDLVLDLCRNVIDKNAGTLIYNFLEIDTGIVKLNSLYDLIFMREACELILNVIRVVAVDKSDLQRRYDLPVKEVHDYYENT